MGLATTARGAALAAVLSAAACGPATPTVAVAPPVPAAPSAPPRRPLGKPVLVPQSVTGPDEVAWSPDGKTLAVSAAEGVLLVDPDRGAIRGALPKRGEIAWTADGTTLVIKDFGEISSWSAATGARRAAVSIKDVNMVAWNAAAVATQFRGAITVSDPLTGAGRGSFPFAAVPASLAIGREGRRVAVGGDDGTVQVWDVAGGPARVLTGSGAVRGLALSPRETAVAALRRKQGGSASVLSIWDVEAPKERRQVEIPAEARHTLAWLPDGSAIALNLDEKAFLVRADTGELTELGEAWGMRPSPSGKVVGLLRWSSEHTASTRAPPSVDVWRLAVRELEHGVESDADLEGGLFNGPLEVAFRAGDDRIGYAYRGFMAYGGKIGATASASAEAFTLEGSPPACASVGWEDGGSTLVTLFESTRLRWSSTGGKIVPEAIEPEPAPQMWGPPEPEPLPPPEPDPFAEVLVGEAPGRTISFVPPRRPGQGKVNIAREGQKTVTLTGVEATLGLGAGGELLAAVRGDAVVIFGTADGKPRATLRVARRKEFLESDVLWSPDGATLLVRRAASEKHKNKVLETRAGFELWDTRSGKQLFATKDGRSFRFGSLGAPPSPALAFAVEDRVVVLDARTGAERASLPGKRCADPTMAGDRVLAVCRDGGGKPKPTLWDASARREIALAPLPASATLSPDGAHLVGSDPGKDGSLLWDARTGALLDRLARGESASSSWSPDGRFLALAHQTGATVVRLADRKRLRFVERAQGGVAFTDDLLFDGDAAASAVLRARLGDDLLRAETVTLAQLEDRYRRRGLVEEFFAGKPIALPPELQEGVGVPPGLTLGAAPVEGDQTTVTLRVVDRGGGIEGLVLLVDGKGVDVAPPTSTEREEGVVERKVPVPVTGKKAVISAYATATLGGTRSAAAEVTAASAAKGSKDKKK